MKKLLTITCLFFTVLSYAQDSEIYCAIFKNNKNFNYLNFYDSTTKENMTYYRVIDVSFQIHYKAFKFNKETNYTQNLADSIKISKTLHSPAVYSDYISKISNILSIEDQDYLYNQTFIKEITDTVNFNCDKVLFFNKLTMDNGFYFQVSNILYFKEKTRAFVKVNTYSRNREYGDFLHGYSSFIFSYKNGKWIQTFEYESIFL